MIMESCKYLYMASLMLIWNELPLTESSVNLALKKNTSQSSQLSNETPSSNAVDGVQGGCSSSGLAHTNDGTHEWWQVDLGEVFEIKRIQIYYRTSFINRLDGYAINITQLLNPLETWQCYKDTENGWPTNLTPSHNCSSLGRYVKFSRERSTLDLKGDKAVINLCELEVYGCPQGRYGNENCNSSCSAGCLNSRCDPDNGQCNCSSGWSGVKCDHIQCNTGSYLQGHMCFPCSTGCVDNICNVENGACVNGCKPSLYGIFCDFTCPQNCYNTSCARYTGKCIGCKVGLHGDKCDEICPRNCKDNVCKQDDGYCTNCNHPYKGNKCTECVDGYFGDKCTNCSEGCLDRKCEQRNGHCTCKHSFFGYKCNRPCPANCKNNKCHQTTGDCVDGCKNLSVIGEKCNECVDGFYGISCNLTCSKTCNKCIRQTGLCARFLTATEGTDNPTIANIGLIIVGIISLINTVFIIILFILYYNRRRRKETVYENQKVMGSPQTGTNQIDNYNPEQQQTVHYETLGLSDRGSINTNSAEAYTGLNMIEARLHENDNS